MKNIFTALCAFRCNGKMKGMNIKVKNHEAYEDGVITRDEFLMRIEKLEEITKKFKNT